MIVKVLGVDGQGKIKLSRRQAGHASESEIANA
jgi:predicted RNA-binding protein with RPS1 domain